MIERETVECEHCHEFHEAVGWIGEIPIVHCPTIEPEHRQMIVSDLSKGRRD